MSKAAPIAAAAIPSASPIGITISKNRSQMRRLVQQLFLLLMHRHGRRMRVPYNSQKKGISKIRAGRKMINMRFIISVTQKEKGSSGQIK